MIVLATVALWFAFAITFPLARWAQTKPHWVQQLVYPLAAAFYLSDVFYNAVVGSLLFLEVPQEWTFSERVERHLLSDGWRVYVARFFAWIILQIDPKHFD